MNRSRNANVVSEEKRKAVEAKYVAYDPFVVRSLYTHTHTHTHDRLRNDHQSLQHNLTNTSSKYAEYMDEKEKSERDYETLLSNLRSQLQNQMADFQDLQAKLEPPRDLDALRIRIQEEVEIPHRQRERELEAEIAKFRKLYFEEKRGREISESKREQSETDRDIEIEASVRSKNKLIATLRKQIETFTEKLVRADHTEDQDTTSLRAKVTNLIITQNKITPNSLHYTNTQVAELQIRNEQLVSEISSTRKEKSDAVIRLEEKKLSHVHELASWEIKTNRAFADVKEIERKCARLEERLEKANSTCDSQRKTLSEKDSVLRKLEQERDSERETNRKMVNKLQVRGVRERKAREIVTPTLEHRYRYPLYEVKWSRINWNRVDEWRI